MWGVGVVRTGVAGDYSCIIVTKTIMGSNSQADTLSNTHTHTHMPLAVYLRTQLEGEMPGPLN